MNPRYDERYANDTTPSREVVRRYREVFGRDDSHAGLALVHYRGAEEEFQIGKECCASSDPLDRATGADVLAQLGWSDQTFRDESIALLIPLLDDPDRQVIYSSAVALGHRKAECAIPALIKLSDHPDSLIRYGVVLGLLGQEDDRAITCLIKLSTDDDRSVRNWSVFGLGSQIETDTPEICAALRHVLIDADHEIRGEALVGLSERGDPGIVDDLIREWGGEFISRLSLEAAHLVADSRLHPYLKEMSESLVFSEEDRDFEDWLARAMKACERGPLL